MRRLDADDGQDLLSAVTRRGEVVVEGHSVGHVAGFGFLPDPSAVGDAKKLVLRAARRALREEMPRRVARAESAPDTAFQLTDDHHILWDEAQIARLRPGATALRPRVEMLDSEFLDGAQRERLRTRLQGFIDARIRLVLAPLFAAAPGAEAVRDARGALHRLGEGLGVAPSDDTSPLSPVQRAQLKLIGARAGRFALYVPALLKPHAAALRAQLWAAYRGMKTPPLPAPGLVSLAVSPDWPADFATSMGWLDAGPVLLRLDVAERVAAELAWATRRGATVLPTDLAGRFAVKTELMPAVLRYMGFRALPGGGLAQGGFGPPTPPMLVPLRRRRPAPPNTVPAPVPHGPFAALATLKR
jgi:ATP-dependent RNA helicase SUPV3L1/SUV3